MLKTDLNAARFVAHLAYFLHVSQLLLDQCTLEDDEHEQREQ